MKNTRGTQARWLALLAATAVAIYLCWLMLKPFVAVLAWASVLVIVFFPVHKRITRVIKKPGLCAALSTVLVIAAILVPFSLITAAVVRELSGMADYLQTNLPELLDPNSSSIGRAVSWLQSHAGLSEVRLRQILADTLKTASASLAGQTLGLVGGGHWGNSARLLCHRDDVLPFSRWSSDSGRRSRVSASGEFTKRSHIYSRSRGD